jgi:hypothetical protein
MMHTQLVIVRVKGQPRLLFCILLSVLKVTFTNNRRDGFVKLGWQQRVLNDKGPGLLAFVTLIPFPPLPSATCLSFSAFLCVRGEGYGDESFDRRKAWPSINHSILSGWQAGAYAVCAADYIEAWSYLLR